MRFTRKISAIILALIMSVGMLAGCANNVRPAAESQSGQGNGRESGKVQSEDPQQDITLRFMWWGGDERHKATLAAIEAYMAKNPHIKIEGEYQGYDGYRDKLTTQLSGGTTADIVQFDFLWREELAGSGDFFADYNEYADIIDLSQFEMDIVEPYGKINGKLFGLPTGSGPMALMVNKKSCEKYGVDTSYNWTWEDMIKEGKKVNASDPEAYFLWGNEYENLLRPYVIQKTGTQFVNDDYTLGFAREDLVDAFDYIRRMYDEKVHQPAAEAYAYKSLSENPKWLDGRVVATIDYASMLESNFQTNPEDAEVIMIPIADGARNSGIVCPVAQLLCVSKDSKHVEESVKFVNAFLNDPDMVKILGTVRSVPSSHAALETLEKAELLNPIVKKAVDLAFSNPGLVNNSITENGELTSIAMDIIEQLRYKKLTSEQAADEFISRFESKLEELKLLN